MNSDSWKKLSASVIVDNCPYFTDMFTARPADPSTLFFRLVESVESNQYEGEIQSWWDGLSNKEKAELFKTDIENINKKIESLQEKLTDMRLEIDGEMSQLTILSCPRDKMVHCVKIIRDAQKLSLKDAHWMATHLPAAFGSFEGKKLRQIEKELRDIGATYERGI